jgi:surfeit locus 1 family protein
MVVTDPGCQTGSGGVSVPTQVRRRLEAMSWVRALVSPQMLLLHLLAVFAVSFAGWLGWWQISAWQEQRQDRAAELVDDSPRPLAEVFGPDDPFPGEHVGRPVVVSGEWVPDSTVYVTDRRRTAEAADDGVWQVALLTACTGERPCEQASVVPVVLGWAPEASGTQAPSGTAEVTGWLQPAEQGGRDEDPTDDLMPSLRSADLLQRTDRDLYSGYVILDEPGSLRGELVAVTPETLPEPPPSTALRNLLYGVEWWVFAAFAVYLWWRWSRDAVLAARRKAPAEPVPSNV